MDALANHPLRIYICGRLAIESGAHVVREAAFPARQGRRLWAYLVLRRQWRVGREDLANAVWGEDFPDAGDSSLSALIRRLRAMLAPSPVIILRSRFAAKLVNTSSLFPKRP